MRLNTKERQLLERLCTARPEMGLRWIGVGAAFLLGGPVIVLTALTDFQTAWATRPMAMAAAHMALMLLFAIYGGLRFALRFRLPQLVLQTECLAVAVFAVALLIARAGQFTAMPVYLGFYLLFALLILYAFAMPRMSLSVKLWRMAPEARSALLEACKGEDAEGEPPL